MILGILSDTHGNCSRAKSALHAMRDYPVGHVIHCGDLGSEEIVSLLFELQENGIPVTAVAGNVDEWDPGIRIFGKKMGVPLHGQIRLNLGGLRAGVCHGHDPRVMDSLLQDPNLEVLFTGHTHIPRDERVGPLRVLNPGAIHRAPLPGYAFFDTETGEWRRVALEGA